MRTLSIYFFAIIFGGILSAQTGNTVTYYNLDLIDKRINLLNNPILLTEVIDATGTNNAPIGTAHKGLSNRAVQIVFPGGLQASFNDLISATPQDHKYSAAKVRITGITDNEFIGSAEVRKVEIEAELAVKKGETYLVYGPLRYADIHVGLDVTSGHSQAVVSSFDTIVRRLTRLYHLEGPAREIPASDVGKANLDYPINTTDFAKTLDGFYETFMDFRAAHPGIKIEPDIRRELKPFTDAKGQNFSILTFKKPKGIKAREFNGYWGAHINGKPYMKIQDRYFEIKLDDSLGFAVALPSEVYRQSANGMAVGVASGMFGLVGGILVFAATSNNNDYEMYSFSPGTGLVTPKRKLDQAKMERGVMLSSSVFSSKKQSLTVLLADGTQENLSPGNHLLLGNQTEICFTIGEEELECQPVEQSSSPQVLYQLLIKNNGKYRLELMPDAEAKEKFIDNQTAKQ